MIFFPFSIFDNNNNIDWNLNTTSPNVFSPTSISASVPLYYSSMGSVWNQSDEHGNHSDSTLYLNTYQNRDNNSQFEHEETYILEIE